MNILTAWPWLARKVSKLAPYLTHQEKTDKMAELLPVSDVLEAIVACGFGFNAYAGLARSKEKLASYFMKIAGDVEGTAGEVAKTSQVPMDSAHGFRRLRSGRGFLPPRMKSEKTGCIVAHVGPRGHRTWRPMSRPLAYRTYVDDGPPRFRPQGPTLWLDMKNRKKYGPDWAGWAGLPCSTSKEPEDFVLVIDLRERGTPSANSPPTRARSSSPRPAAAESSRPVERTCPRLASTNEWT